MWDWVMLIVGTQLLSLSHHLTRQERDTLNIHKLFRGGIER